MSDRQDEFDQTHAIFAALGSFWWRVALFFVLCLLGHYVGLNCASAADFFRSIVRDGPQAIFDHGDLNPAWVPVSWLGTLLVGCWGGWGLLQLAALAVAFLFVWLSEDRYLHGLALVALTQPVDSFLVAHGIFTGSTPATADFFIGLGVLVAWEAVIGFAYWWCLQQME